MYNIDNYLIPYWSGNTMYDESAFVLEDENGDILPINLLYKPDKILSVTDSELKITYKEDTDYSFEDGVLKVLPGGNIPVMKYKDYYLDEPIEGKSFERQNGKYLAFAETVLMYPKQIAVTYTHSDSWNGFIPEKQGTKLPKLMKKLENKEPVKILLFGDSIAAGANATSRSGRGPGLPSFSAHLLGAGKMFIVHLPHFILLLRLFGSADIFLSAGRLFACRLVSSALCNVVLHLDPERCAKEDRSIGTCDDTDDDRKCELSYRVNA